jgi:hypothetical protein
MIKKVWFIVKISPVICFAIGLGLAGAALRIYEKIYNEKNLKIPTTGKTKGL